MSGLLGQDYVVCDYAAEALQVWGGPVRDTASGGLSLGIVGRRVGVVAR
ncbi:MAG: hypothetical protein AAF364_04790 [Pseudomonadota bacterium]